MVGRGRIELPTPGFSVPCSTDCATCPCGVGEPRFARALTLGNASGGSSGGENGGYATEIRLRCQGELPFLEPP